MKGVVIGGSLDGMTVESPHDTMTTRTGEKYLWLSILVGGKERVGLWRVEFISDGFALEQLIQGYRRK